MKIGLYLKTDIIKLKHGVIRVGPDPMSGVLIRREDTGKKATWGQKYRLE